MEHYILRDKNNKIIHDLDMNNFRFYCKDTVAKTVEFKCDKQFTDLHSIETINDIYKNKITLDKYINSSGNVYAYMYKNIDIKINLNNIKEISNDTLILQPKNILELNVTNTEINISLINIQYDIQNEHIDKLNIILNNNYIIPIVFNKIDISKTLIYSNDFKISKLKW